MTQKQTQHTRLRALPLWLLAAGCATGCASVDPTADLAIAAATVAERSGHTPAWDAPWNTPSTAWDGVAPLSADAATLCALQNNRALRAALLTISIAKANVAQADLPPNPMLGIAFGFPADSGAGESIVAGVVQQLAWLWQRPTKAAAAEATLRQSILLASDIGLRTAAAAKSAHANVWAQQHMVTLETEHLALLEQTTSLLHRNFDAGEALRLDVNRAELDLAAAKTSLTARNAALAIARRTLLAQLGRADTPLAGQHTFDCTSFSTPQRPPFDETEAIELAKSQRLDVAAAHAAVQSTASLTKLAELQQLPDIGITMGYERTRGGQQTGMPGLSITPKLFDNGTTAKTKAKAIAEQTRIEASRIEQAAILETRTAWISLHAALDQCADYEGRILSLANENVRLATHAYKAGVTDLTTLLATQRSRIAAELQYTDLLLASQLAWIELHRAAGGSLLPKSEEHADAS